MSTELINDGGDVTLGVFQEVAVEVYVEESHAVEVLELGGILLGGLDSRRGDYLDRSRGDDNNGFGLLFNADNVNPDAVAKRLSRWTVHAPVGYVATSLLGSLHFDGDGDGRSGRNLAGDLNVFNGAETLTSVGFEAETASKRPSVVARVGQTPDLVEGLASSDLSTIRHGNVAQEVHFEALRGNDLNLRDNGSNRLGTSGFNDANGLNRSRDGAGDDRGRGFDERNGNSGRVGKGRSRCLLLLLLLRLLRLGRVVTMTMTMSMMTTISAACSPAASSATTTRRVHREGVILVQVHSSITALLAKVVVGADVALVEVSRDGIHFAAVTDVIHVNAVSFLGAVQPGA
jgi:hypothetical protein